MNKIKELTNKIGLTITAIVLFVYNIFVLINILVGQGNQFASRILIMIALIVLIILQVIQIVINIKEKNFLHLAIDIILVLFSGFLLYKYFSDNPVYFRHNNLTIYLFQIVLIIKLGVLIFDKNKVINFLAFVGVMIFLLIIQGLKIYNTGTKMFYINAFWVNLSYLLSLAYLYLFANFKLKHDKVVMISIFIFYSVVSLIVSYLGKYTVTHLKLLFEIFFLSMFLTNLYSLVLKKEKIIINTTFLIILFIGFIVLMVIPNSRITFHLFLIIYLICVVLFITVLNFRKNLFNYIIFGISLILIVLLFVFLGRLNLMPFMGIMSLSYIVILVYYIISNKQLLKAV